ncbi:class I adenylate-forming enzyme family protein [Plantactinospora sp. WMMB334]|uniref:class I adenylate-forming enzyme family protein n=1 Tax=Plantactinospora sp. WMMB334 TaxID=3404119 RepID=UPI003B92B632
MTADNLRASLLADSELGAGNVLARLLHHGAAPTTPAVAFDVDVDGHPAYRSLSLGELRERVAARASWLHRNGVRPRDPVAIYVSSSADCLLSFLALNWLGAIPTLMNGGMPGEIAVEFIRRLRASYVLTDAAHRRLLGDAELGAPLLPDVAEAGTGDPAGAPTHYRFHPEDPIVITHTSGTTRLPASVVHSHTSLFAATRELRLAGLKVPRGERILSVLPAAHTAGILTLHQALLSGSELLFLSGQGSRSGQGGPFESSAAVVVAAIEDWRPTNVYGFAVTWAELARVDLSQHDLSSVEYWFNTGDSAHETHIRRLVAAGSHRTYTRGGWVREPGSRFIDGIGSSEMGYSAFRIIHGPDTERYGRCVGKPHIFADVALLDLATGEEVPVGEVGHLGLKSPTLALGYWNDSVLTYRTRLRGYYLTGDLMYRDAEGYHYHLDRAADAVDLGGGAWLYTAMTEERILVACPELRDCTVVAGREGDRAVTDVLLMLESDADPAADRTEAVRAALGPAAAATLRNVVVVPEDEIILGPTGKVRKFLMRQRHLHGGHLPGTAGRTPVAHTPATAG